MANRQAERFRAAAIIYSNPDFGGSVANALVKADALLALVEADGGPIDGPAQIGEELDAESRSITVYPCPRCGEGDRDGNAAMIQQVIDMAKDAGWDGMDPLLDWLELQIDRATMYLDGEDAGVSHVQQELLECALSKHNVCRADLKAALEAVQHWTERAMKAEAEVVRWGKAYDAKMQDFDKSLYKWRGLVGSNLNTNQPELHIEIDAALQELPLLRARAEKAEAGLARTGNLTATAILYSAGQASWQALKDAVMRYEREVQG